MHVDMAQVYTDFSGLAAMKARAREDQEAALDQVARQFESLFLQMMLKSMRDASLGDGMLDSKQSEFYREMYDQQIALHLSEQKGIGLAEQLKQQLGGAIAPTHRDLSPEDYLGTRIFARQAPAVPAGETAETGQARASIALDGSPEGFLQSLWPLAEKAAAEIDLAPEALLAQAALETGWGRHVMQHRGGGSSHNLFGIKADSRWQGDSVRVDTLEYRDGVALNTRASFRAYDSFDESFRDYVDFVQENPRYRDALRKTSDAPAYFEALQQAGYATDPAYANKIRRILDSDSMQSARQQRQEGGAAI